MQEGSVSLFFGSYGLLFYFYGSGFPACPFSRAFRLACFFGSSGLPVFSGFRFACFFGFSGLPVFPGSRLARFPGSSGLPVFPGLPAARFLWFPACPFSRVSGLPVFPGFRLACFFGFSGLFSGFPVFSRAFRSFFCFVSRIFPFFVLYLQGGCSVLSVRKEIHKSSARIASR